MNKNLVIALISISSLLGCTTMQAVNVNGGGIAEELERGDQLVIRLKSGQVLEMTLVSFDGEVLRGVNGESRSLPVEVPLSEVQRIEVEQIDGVRTAKVVGGVLLLVVLAAALAVSSGGSGANFDGDWSFE